MKTFNIVGIIISLVVGIVFYLTGNNYIVASVIFVVYLAYFLFIGSKTFKVFLGKTQRIHNVYHFINSFLITLSVKDSLDDAFYNATQGAEEYYGEIILELNEMTTIEKIKYLNSYFDLAVYSMFLNVVDIYLDQGGNILNIADTLILETTRVEDTLNKSIQNAKTKLIEFATLWAISVFVLIFMRFSLSDFYFSMLKNPIFFTILVVFYALLLFSIHLFLKRYTYIYLKEGAGEWKSSKNVLID